MTDASTFAVVGAGPSGLAVAKALRDKNIPYIQFEANHDIGGNWLNGVYETVHIISSKKATEFADFPMPESYPDFPSGKQMLEYLQNFVQTFDLRQSIRFNTSVTAVTLRPDKLWNVELSDGTWHAFKGVIICNGHHWDRRYPAYPGTYSGTMLHSKDYKSAEQLKGKRVLVIGGGNSACDIASEAARVGASSSISLRRGYWFLPKTIFGTPLTEIFSVSWPVWAQRLVLKAALKVTVGDYEKFGLPKPDHDIFDKHPTVNSELLHYLRHGRITAYPDIKNFDGSFVEFVNGKKEEFDVVVCATGYHLSFPCLPSSLLTIKNGVVELYGGCALPNAKNLYVFGSLQPRYGFGPLMTPAAVLLSELINMQEHMELPIGLVLKSIGDKPPNSPLIDPYATMRLLKSFKHKAGLVRAAEKQLRGRVKAEIL